MLSRGQTIEHSFPLLNPADRPMRILDARAQLPCCSEVVEAPAVVPARGEGRLLVRFKPGFGSGRKSVPFLVTTDRAEEPVRVYTLRSELVAGIQVATTEGRGLSLMMGEPGRQVLRIVSRRLGDQGRPAPETVEGAGQVRARFDGPTRQRRLENGVVEETRDVIVDLPPRSVEGAQTASLTFGWADGRPWEHLLHWGVSPHLTANPAAFVLQPRDDPVGSVVVRSRTSPFRILGIEGPGTRVLPSPSEPGRSLEVHVVKVAFDRDRLPGSGPFDVTIRTDHPEQPEVVVSVLMTSSGE